MQQPRRCNLKGQKMSEKTRGQTDKRRIPPWLYLSLILLLALFLRLAGIWRAEPINHHPDEWNLANPVMALANDAQAGLIYRYNWPGCGAIRLVGYSLYALKPVFGPYSYNEILIILRVLSALASAATVLVSYVLVRKLFNNRAALLAALLISVAKSPVILGHYGTVDSIGSVVIVLVMWLSCDLFEIDPEHQSPTLRAGRCCIIGLICGWGIASKWTLLLAAIPIATALFLTVIARRKLGHWRRFIEVNLKRIAIIGGMTLLAFLAFLPDLQIAPQKVLSGFEYEMVHHKTGHHGAVTADQAGLDKRLIRTYTAFNQCGSIYLTLAGIAAVIFALVKPTRRRYFLLLTMLLWLMVLLRNIVAPIRHHLIPFMLMLMLTAVLFDKVFGSEKKYLRLAGIVVFVIVTILATLYTCIAASPFWKPDARVMCSNWIQANVPKGSGVTWAPRTPHWAAPGEWVAPSLFKSYPRRAEPGKDQYIIVTKRNLEIFKKHPPTKPVISREWFPNQPPSMQELLLYAEMNAGGGNNLQIVKKFENSPSFLRLDLGFFAMDPETETTSANRAVVLFKVKSRSEK